MNMLNGVIEKKIYRKDGVRVYRLNYSGKLIEGNRVQFTKVTGRSYKLSLDFEKRVQNNKGFEQVI